MRGLLNCTIFNDLENFNDLEQPQMTFSRSGHSLMLNIFEMDEDTAIVTMEGK